MIYMFFEKISNGVLEQLIRIVTNCSTSCEWFDFQKTSAIDDKSTFNDGYGVRGIEGGWEEFSEKMNGGGF